MKVSFNYNNKLYTIENVINIDIHEDDSHEERYLKIWRRDSPAEEMWSEDHYIENLLGIEAN